MKLQKIMQSFQAVQSFLDLSISYQKARILKKIYDTMKSEVDFYLQEEKKLIHQFAKKDEDGNPVLNGNKIQFENTDSANKYLAEITKLNELDVSVDFEPVVLTENEIGSQCISVNALEQIEGFITIE